MLSLPGASSGPSTEERAVSKVASALLSSTLWNGFPEMPSSIAGVRSGAGACWDRNLSVTGVEDLRVGRESVEPGRLAGGLKTSEEARPLLDVERPGETKKASVRGEEVEIEGPTRAGTTMGVGRSLCMAAMTR